MNQTNTAPAEATIGHNNPPSEFELFAQELTNNHAKTLARAQALIQAGQKLPAKIADAADPADTASKLTTLVKQITTCFNAVEDARTKEKKPYLEKGAMVDTFFNANKTALDAIKKKSLSMLKVYSDDLHAAEQARMKEEAAHHASLSVAKTELAATLAPINVGASEAALEDALLSDNKAQKFEAAAAQSTGLVAIKATSGGATAARRTVKSIRIVDLNKLDLEALRLVIPLPALQTACNALLRQGITELAGCVIEENTDVVVR